METSNGRRYAVDENGFLLETSQWDDRFARETAVQIGIPNGLSEKHWEVINYIRSNYRETGDCPLVYQTCRAARLSFRGFRELFPTGYLRGACLLAGVTYKDRFINYYGEPGLVTRDASKTEPPPQEKGYRVDVQGFLLDASEWDEGFASGRAPELRIRGGLTSRHWKIIQYLRESYKMKGTVPTFFECCEGNEIELDALEQLFPDGYHRGAVKLAGLRVR